MKVVFILSVVLVLAGDSVYAADAAGQLQELKVGFSQVDITPPVGGVMTGQSHSITERTEDPLRAKALVVQSGGRTLAIVGLDLVKIRRDLADAAIAQARERTGIARDAVMLCPSHNHSSPLIPDGGPANQEYLSDLPGLIADCIEQAHQALQPARMFLGRSLVYEGHHNRRVISKTDGLVLNTWLKKTDDLKQTPQILGSEGPIDPELWVARFDAPDGRVLGTLVNFACHPNLRKRTEMKSWSADFPGVIADHIAEAYGKETVSVFTQGCSGNISPASGQSVEWREKATVFAEAAVDAAKRAVPVEGPIAVAYTRLDVTVPRRDPADQREGAIERLDWIPERFASARQNLGTLPETRSVPVNAGRIGPLGIATNAGELFVEYGISVKKRSPFPHTFVCELTNDAIGYEPTARAFGHEGYETLAGKNNVSLEGIETLVDTAAELLEKLWADN